MRAEVKDALKGIADVERLTSRVLQQIAHPRNLLDLRHSLERIPALMAVLQAAENPHFTAMAQQLDPCAEVVKLLAPK